MSIGSLTAALIYNRVADTLDVRDIGVFMKLTSEGSGLTSAEPRVFSIEKHCKDWGISWTGLRNSLHRLGQAGFINLDSVTGVKGARRSLTIRLLTVDEWLQRLTRTEGE